MAEWSRKWQPTPVFLTAESHGHRSLVDYSPRGCKESDTTEALEHACRQLIIKCSFTILKGFPCGLAGKESACNVGDLGLFPGLGRSPGEGKGYPL